MKVAFVVQRCGREVNGGAETLCLQVAQRMAKHWHTEVLTTCALDYMTWENTYPVGPEQLEGTTIRRFPVDHPRDVKAFDRLSAELHPRQRSATLVEQENWMRAQGPVSSGLLEILSREKKSFDAFIFFGYLYATTYFGLPLVKEKAYLAPFAHDEWTIYFTMWDKLFSLPTKLIFSATAEQDFLRERFPGLPLPGPIIGVGIDAPHELRPAEFCRRYRLEQPFLLYVGRIDESKGCRWLIESFIRARAEGIIEHKLVLIGAETMPVPFHDDIIYLGFVEGKEKWDAMAACDWLINPSQYESLSIVLLEAWMAERPCLVNAASAVLVDHCQRSHGGLWYHTYEEWIHILTTLDEATKGLLGSQGKQYVRNNYSWDRVEREYLALMG